MSIRQIIRCPHCEESGEKENLAELLDSGAVSVQRIRKGISDPNKKFKSHTLILGANFSIVCGGCGKPAYRRGE